MYCRVMLALKIPNKINIKWGSDFLSVEGPLGCLIKRKIGFNLAIKDSTLFLWADDLKANENTYLNSIRAMIFGVGKGVSQKLKLHGTGFRAILQNNTLILKLGFSHEIKYTIPEDINILVSKNKGTIIIIKGKEKHRVQQIAREIRQFREPDAYKHKGIQFKNEIFISKKGKKEGK